MKKPIKVAALALLLASTMLIAKKSSAEVGVPAAGCSFTDNENNSCHIPYGGVNYSVLNCVNDTQGSDCGFDVPN